MENEKVSIIIPVYNSESTISRAVNSALTQTYKNIAVNARGGIQIADAVARRLSFRQNMQPLLDKEIL